jgi:hypothetical protein
MRKVEGRREGEGIPDRDKGIIVGARFIETFKAQ